MRVMRRMFVLHTMNDIEDVIREFGLDHFEWGEVGSARGFAHWLMVRRQWKPLLELASDLCNYRRECESLGTDAVDARNAIEVLAIQEKIFERTAQREEVAAFIRDVKLEASAVYWSMLAHLATVKDLGEVLQHMSADDCRHVLNIVEALHPLLRRNFECCIPMHEDTTDGCYEPGLNWAMNHFVRKEIERLDVHLANALQYHERYEEYSEEIAALLFLFERKPLREELVKVIKAEAAGSAAVVTARRWVTIGKLLAHRLAIGRRRRGVSDQPQ